MYCASAPGLFRLGNTGAWCYGKKHGPKPMLPRKKREKKGTWNKEGEDLKWRKAPGSRVFFKIRSE